MEKLESNISNLDLSLLSVHSDMVEALKDPSPMEMEGVQKQGEEKVESTLIWDMALEEEQGAGAGRLLLPGP